MLQHLNEILSNITYYFRVTAPVLKPVLYRKRQRITWFLNTVKVIANSFSAAHKIDLLAVVSRMGVKHLEAGSEFPAKTGDKLRLYSMEYCPFVHRVRLVLRAKNIDHEIININLMNKPEWLFKLHPEGKVPALDVGDKVIVESLDICDYLDQTYPNPPLYPAEPLGREQDKALFDVIGNLHGIFINLLLKKETKSAQEWKEEFKPYLTQLDEELSRRGTTYFGGDNPGMVDYVLWPWAERAGTVGIVLGEKLPFQPDELRTIRSWRKTMQEHPVVAGIYHGPEKFYKSVQIKLGELPPDYDNI